MKQITYLLLIFFGTTCIAQNTSISGRILSQGEPVPFANVYFANSGNGTTSNEEGEYLIKTAPKGNHILVISAIGFRTFRKNISISENQQIQQDFELEVSSDKLDEILIVDEQTGLTGRTPYNVTAINMQGIESKGNPNGMMGTLREVPGVYGAEFGQGIVKPFIRGLGFSRIVTIYQGNKLENHQWGADHGLGINDLGIKRVDVIKGPSSVLYGSGALGGVLLAKDDEKYLKSNRFTGNIGTTFNSVSNGLRTYASLGRSFKNGLFVATDLAYENHADYKNGDGRVIGNSRFNTSTLRLHTGITKNNFQNKLSFSYNNQNLGIIIDEEMDPEESLATERKDRSMQLPFQEVEDYLVSYNQTTKNENFETSLHLSHHFNDRKEIEDNINSVDLGLLQNHTFYNARLSLPSGKIKHSFGAQGSFVSTRNRDNARDFLIPDADVFENGLYYLASANLDSWFLQGALRYDYRKVTADASSENLVRDEFILPGNPENRKLTRTFSGFTGSLGATKKIGENNRLKLNISTGFRAPDLAELFSNGPHPGTNRYEQGNDNFDREQSLQADVSYIYQKQRFQATISVFGNLVDNYIFFASTDERRPEDNLEIWSYLQTNAGFYGFEFEFKHTWLAGQRLETKASGAIVRAEDRVNNRNLSFIPPDNYNFEAGYYALQDKSLFLFSKLRLIDEQYRPGFNEDPTPGYALLNFGLSKKLDIGRNSLNAAITIYNALDKIYVDHMSILRAFHVGSPGRNIMVNLKYDF